MRSDEQPIRLALVAPNGRMGRGIAVALAGQEAGACPSSYAPPTRDNFFRRLRFHFSIGQPF